MVVKAGSGGTEAYSNSWHIYKAGGYKADIYVYLDLECIEIDWPQFKYDLITSGLMITTD